MKFLSAAFWLFLLTVGCLSQTQLNPQAVELIEKKWDVEIRNPRLDEDPFRDIKDTEQEIKDRKQTIREETIRAKRGMPPVQPRRSPRQPRSGLETITTSYVYRAKFKNTGKKTIRTLTWEYVFFDPETKVEVGRRRFESKVKIAPGKTQMVIKRLGSPPTNIINVTQVGKNVQDQYVEQVIIQSIRYADGSVWTAPVAGKMN
jgi:hypothetical protein